MSDVEQKNADPIARIMQSKSTVWRVVALLCVVAGLILPAVTSSAMGMSQSTSILQLAAWSLISPLAIGIAIIIPGLTPNHSRLADVVASVIAAIVAAYTSYVIFDAINQVSQVGGMTGRMAQSMGASISPSFGLFLVIGAVILMSISASKGQSK